MTMLFFPGLHHPCDAINFTRCMVSIAALRQRKSNFAVKEWILDSGAFSEVKTYGKFRESVATYASQVRTWTKCGQLLAAVSQDFMCEPFILEKTKLTVKAHQEMTIQRYDELDRLAGDAAYIMPVLQGYWPDEYVQHIKAYGCRLAHGAWVGVGSVCKRNAKIESIEQVLMAIKQERSDLRLHGFGVKITALESSLVRDCLWSADSMAWSAAARWERRDRNSWREAAAFEQKIIGQTVRRRVFQMRLF